MLRVKHCQCDSPEVGVVQMDGCLQVECRVCGSGQSIRSNLGTTHEDYERNKAAIEEFTAQSEGKFKKAPAKSKAKAEQAEQAEQPASDD